MSILNHIAYVSDPSEGPPDFLDRLSDEGFSHVCIPPDGNALERLAQVSPAAILASARLDPHQLGRVVHQIRERFSHIPILLKMSRRDQELPAPETMPAFDGLCYDDVPSAHMAAVLRGVIRSSFTVQELVHSNRKLNEISITDALTGLHNRGYMIDRLNLEFKRAERNQESLTCLMIDLDHFKQVNDTYGHKFGDVILRAVSRRLRGLIRETDIFGRYGGEEFLIVLPNTSLEGGELLAEKLRAGLEAERVTYECFSLMVTASFGVASTEIAEVITADHLLQLSDRALYQAKESGRNRVCVAGVGDTVAEPAPTARKRNEHLHRSPGVHVLSARPENSRHIQALLESPEFELTLHASEADFFEQFRSSVPHLIIVEHAPEGEPPVDAATVSQRVKTQVQDLFIPFMVLMPEPDDEQHQLLLEAGADDVIDAALDTRDFKARLQVMVHLKELHDRWRSTYRDLTMARTRLVKAERLTALGEMASGVAHDFNNVLSAILGRTQILRQHVGDADVIKDLQVIEQAANDGAATIRRIQEFARSTTNRAYQIVELAQIVQDCIQMTRTRWKDQAEVLGLEYHFHAHLEDNLTVMGSSTELREVVTNLIMNGLDAMPKGGEMTFEGSVRDGEVVLVIADTGVGMDEEVVKRVFDPFFSTKHGEGSGLGLSVAYGIVARHNGRIECTSEVGSGTQFRIHLPHKRPAQPAPQPPAPQRDPSLGKRALNVLVVDDEMPIREIFKDILTEEGHDVSLAESGEQALDMLREKPVDLVFTDLSMPGMNGWEVARQVRRMYPDTTIILTSGWGKDFNSKHLARHGVDYVLPKPVTFETLQEVTRQVSEGRPIQLIS